MMYIKLMEVLPGSGPYDGEKLDAFLMENYGRGKFDEEAKQPRVAIPATRIGTELCDVQLFRNYKLCKEPDDPVEKTTRMCSIDDSGPNCEGNVTDFFGE